jgi:hypothetical protein
MMCKRSLILFDEELMMFSILPENLPARNVPIRMPMMRLMNRSIGENLD